MPRNNLIAKTNCNHNCLKHNQPHHYLTSLIPIWKSISIIIGYSSNSAFQKRRSFHCLTFQIYIEPSSANITLSLLGVLLLATPPCVQVVDTEAIIFKGSTSERTGLIPLT